MNTQQSDLLYLAYRKHGQAILHLLYRQILRHLHIGWCGKSCANRWSIYSFNQGLMRALQWSSRFTALKDIVNRRGHDSYNHTIRSPRIQAIFLRLRIDMNILLTSRSSKIYCLHVHCVPENPKQSNISYSSVIDSLMNARNLLIWLYAIYPFIQNERRYKQLKYILWIHCPPEAIPYYCKHMYIFAIYSLRENDYILIQRHL